MNIETRITLNHMSFPTRDVAAEAQFFKEFLGATIEFVDAGSGSAVLKHGGTDIVLDAMGDSVQWHKDFHFGFELETRRELDALYEKFKNSGATLESEVHNRLGRGSRFVGRTPGGIQYEINTREDMDPKWRK